MVLFLKAHLQSEVKDSNQENELRAQCWLRFYSHRECSEHWESDVLGGVTKEKTINLCKKLQKCYFKLNLKNYLQE